MERKVEKGDTIAVFRKADPKCERVFIDRELAGGHTC